MRPIGPATAQAAPPPGAEQKIVILEEPATTRICCLASFHLSQSRWTLPVVIQA
jgi:hypothetical protein